MSHKQAQLLQSLHMVNCILQLLSLAAGRHAAAVPQSVLACSLGNLCDAAVATAAEKSMQHTLQRPACCTRLTANLQALHWSNCTLVFVCMLCLCTWSAFAAACPADQQNRVLLLDDVQQLVAGDGPLAPLLALREQVGNTQLQQGRQDNPHTCITKHDSCL